VEPSWSSRLPLKTSSGQRVLEKLEPQTWQPVSKKHRGYQRNEWALQMMSPGSSWCV
jgi:hypothetical protein